MTGDKRATDAGSERAGKGVAIGVAAMTVIVAASNYLVQFPINDWLTWGAFSYPIAFLVTDLTNRALGPARARRVVYVGFLFAVVLSLWLAPRGRPFWLPNCSIS